MRRSAIRLGRRRWLHGLAVGLGFVCLLGGGAPAYAEVSERASPSIRKLGRGLANTIGGIFEIPLTMHAVGVEKGPAAGLTLGLLMGVGAAITRTVVGLVEVVTFPFPFSTNGYEPILHPEFIFEPGSSGGLEPAAAH